MDDDDGMLSAGFAIDTQGAFSELQRFYQFFDAGTIRVLDEIRKVEAATGGMMNLSPATREVAAFSAASKRELAAVKETTEAVASGVSGLASSIAVTGAAATREARAAARERAQTNKEIEKTIALTQRETVALSQSKDEARAAKIERLSIGAAKNGNTDAADRLLAAERQRQFALEARAQDLADTAARAATAAAKERAKAEALVNAQLREREQLDAALERNFGVNRAPAVRGGATFSALAAREAEAEAQARRSAALAHAQYEAAVRKGAAAMREEEAAERDLTTRTMALKAAIDPAWASQDRFSREIAEAQALMSAGRITLDDYSKRHWQLQQELKGSTTAMEGQVKASGLAKAGYQQLNFQLSDIATQYASGTKPMQIFAQQSGQLFQALGMIAEGGAAAGKGARAAGAASEEAGVDVDGFGEKAVGLAEKAEGMGGKLGAVAGFMTGPWGAAMLIGVSLLAPLVGKMFEFGDALDDAVEKLKKEAAEAEASRTAQERFKVSAEGVAAAIRDGTEATRLSIEGMRSSAEAANIQAKNNLEHEISIRRVTTAEIEQAKVLAESAKGQAIIGPGGGQSAVINQYVARVGQLQEQLDKQQGLIDQAQARVGQTRIDLAVEAAARAADPLLRIKKLYDDQANAAQRAAAAQMAAGHEVGVALTRELTLIERNRQAALKAEQDKQSASKQTVNQIGRNVSLSEARGIAEGIGGRVTSDHRTFEEQKKLWDKYQAYKAGSGPWAALAAKPGTSNHELDQALDVAKSGGMTLKKLVGAYRSAGVRLVEALDEGSHYHIAWKKVGEAARQQTAEQSDAQREATNAAATAAQIDNLYRLADAYEATGGAALVAGARLKAETTAIKQRGDISAAVARQVEVEIAQRVADAAASTSAMRAQATTQAMVNSLVAGGLVPAERAADLVRDQIADLPLLAALQAAQQVGSKRGIDEATAALERQRSARSALTAEQQRSIFDTDMAASGNRLDDLREELRLVGATEQVRVHALATIRATQEASKFDDPALRTAYVDRAVEVADGQYQLKIQTDAANASLTYQADLLDAIADNVSNAARGMADAFGEVGRAIGDSASIFASYTAQQERLGKARDIELAQAEKIDKAELKAAEIKRVNGLYAARNATAQIGFYGDMATAARGFFKEDSDGYKIATKAMQIFRAVEFALSVRAIAQDAVETGSAIAKSVARTAVSATEAVVNAIKSLPFPLNLAAGAATIGAIASLGVSIAGSFGGGGKLPESNTGTGTVLGDGAAKSESLKRSIDGLRDIDTLMLGTSREMAATLRSIDTRIGGVAALVVRAGDVNASAGVNEGFKTNAIGSVLKAAIPIFGGALAGLFGSKTTVVGSGISGGPQSLGSILNGGFDASYYSDVQKKKKFLGITTGTSYSTKYSGADAGLENQFTLILRDFNSAILAAAGPLGESTDAIQQRLNGFIVNIGKIDLQDLTGEEIQEKLSAVFGAAADKMALAALPGFERFQKVGEGAFETLVRVASTVEAVTGSLDLLGGAARGLGIDAKLGLAGQFDSVSDFNNAADAYFQAFYTKEEQAAAKTAQFAKVFDALGLAMPDTLAGFRQLVDAQILTTAAGQSTYATLLQLAPAFADLKSAMDGAKSAADILAERQDLERKILELNGDTAAIRALDLAKVDTSNRALQEQVWAIEDAQKAAQAAEQLRDAWASVGNGIEDEIRRIRGLTDGSGGTSFVSAMSEFNAATIKARGGDQDAAKLLPALSQALLKTVGDAATSRQELDRVQAQTAASLEQTSAVIAAIAKGNPLTSAGTIAAAAMAAQAASPATSTASEADAVTLRDVRDLLAGLRADNNAGHAATAAQAGRGGAVLERAEAEAGGVGLATVGIAA